MREKYEKWMTIAPHQTLINTFSIEQKRKKQNQTHGPLTSFFWIIILFYFRFLFKHVYYRLMCLYVNICSGVRYVFWPILTIKQIFRVISFSKTKQKAWISNVWKICLNLRYKHVRFFRNIQTNTDTCVASWCFHFDKDTWPAAVSVEFVKFGEILFKWQSAVETGVQAVTQPPPHLTGDKTRADTWCQTVLYVLSVWMISRILKLKLLPYLDDIQKWNACCVRTEETNTWNGGQRLQILIKLKSLTSLNFSLLLMLLHILFLCDECCYAAVSGQIDYSVRSPDSQLSPALLWFAEMSFWLMPAVIISSMAQ